MLAKKFRFHRQNDVRRVYRNGSSARSSHLSLKYLKQHSPSDNRVAVVVSKKVDKKAVIRNRIRRRVYEIIRNTWTDTKQGHDLVFTVHDKSIATIEHPELEAEIKKLLKKAELAN
ncbi:Ribonuclease P protein component [hydrothermal vent metagenome]|uniref:Ribonuclease P protein component n=1 Tax=hydrothermal vent metagenome TaxID=652676 RepID=A0A3B0UHD4_9ZZZZ